MRNKRWIINFKKGYDNMKNVIYLEDALRGYEIEVAKKQDLNGAIVIDNKIVLSREEVKRLMEFLSEDLEGWIDWVLKIKGRSCPST